MYNECNIQIIKLILINFRIYKTLVKIHEHIYLYIGTYVLISYRLERTFLFLAAVWLIAGY